MNIRYKKIDPLKYRLNYLRHANACVGTKGSTFIVGDDRSTEHSLGHPVLDGDGAGGRPARDEEKDLRDRDDC